MSRRAHISDGNSYSDNQPSPLHYRSARFLSFWPPKRFGLSNLRLRTPGVSPGVKASEGWEGFTGCAVKMWG
jgi:hypothetical protein